MPCLYDDTNFDYFTIFTETYKTCNNIAFERRYIDLKLISSVINFPKTIFEASLYKILFVYRKCGNFEG